MRCFRRIVRILGTALMLWICLCQVQAVGAQTETEDGEISVVQEELLGQIELEEIQKLVDGILDEKSFSIKDAVMNMMKGEEPISKEAVQDMVRSFFFFRNKPGERNAFSHFTFDTSGCSAVEFCRCI